MQAYEGDLWLVKEYPSQVLGYSRKIEVGRSDERWTNELGCYWSPYW